MSLWRIEPNEDDEVITCSCCAGMPGVRGFVYRDGAAVAIYFAEPSGMPNYPMLKLGLVIGPWGDLDGAADRLSLVFSATPGPRFEPAEAFLGTFPELLQLGRPFSRDALAKHPQLEDFRAMSAAIVAGDDRLVEMRGGGSRHRPGFAAT